MKKIITLVENKVAINRYSNFQVHKYFTVKYFRDFILLTVLTNVFFKCYNSTSYVWVSWRQNPLRFAWRKAIIEVGEV